LRCREFNVSGREASIDPVTLIDVGTDVGTWQENKIHEPRRYQDTDLEVLKFPEPNRFDVEFGVDERQSLHALRVDIREP